MHLRASPIWDVTSNRRCKSVRIVFEMRPGVFYIQHLSLLKYSVLTKLLG